MTELFRAIYLEAAYRTYIHDEREYRIHNGLRPASPRARQWLVKGLEWTDYPSLFGADAT